MPRRKTKEPSGLIIWYEIITGVFEIILGFLLIIFGPKLLHLYQQVIFSNFFIFDHEWLSDLIETVVPFLFDHYIFVSLSFIGFGIVKIICGVGMYHNKIWADFLLIAALTFLMPFDLVSLFQSFAWYKVVYLIINSAIIYYLFPVIEKN